MKVSCKSFFDGERIDRKFTCDGENINPELKIEGIPEGSQSLVLIVDDIDAPGGVFDHWIVFDLPVKEVINERERGGVSGVNSFGETKYGGPCPHQGEHRYYFRAFALDRKLSLPAGAGRAEVEKAMEGHVLAKAELMGRYSRD